jgi:acetylornithine/N-succinyldiaminopimelate aminotransferase
MTATLSSSQRVINQYQQYVIGNYTRYPVCLVRGEGSYVWDAEGHRYLDFFPGWGCDLLGHCPPRVVEAVCDQVRRLIHVPNTWYTEAQGLLAQALVERLGFEAKCFFCNSGTEANEAMIKLARHYHVANGQPERIEILCFHNSFHGRTLGSLAATGQPKYQQGFGPLPQGFRFLDYGDAGALEAAIGNQTCAVMLEPLQGEAGVLPPPRGYLAKVRELCTKHGALMLLDEVQTGMGRTGAFFAHQHERIEPDAMTLAKGIAGGIPLGALLAREDLAKVFTPGTHASTFGGNPLATAAASAVMDMLSEGLLERVQRAGARLSQRLASVGGRSSGERGAGLLRALLLSEDLAPKVVAKARELGLLVNAIGERVVRLAPPLTVSDDEIDQASGLLAEAVRKA